MVQYSVGLALKGTRLLFPIIIFITQNTRTSIEAVSLRHTTGLSLLVPPNCTFGAGIITWFSSFPQNANCETITTPFDARRGTSLNGTCIAEAPVGLQAFPNCSIARLCCALVTNGAWGLSSPADFAVLAY